MEEFPRNVLVVEDDDGLRALIIKALKKSGFNAEGMASGLEALNSAAADPDLVLVLDQKLPDITGRDMIRILNERSIDVSFVMMTGYGDERLAVEMMKLGAADYLPKDMELTDRLPDVLNRLFQARQTRRRLHAAEEALRRSEEKFRELFENAVEGIFQITPDGRFLSVNPAFVRLLGFCTPDDFFKEGDPAPEKYFVHPEDWDAARQKIETEGVIKGLEIQLYRNDGALLWGSLNARAVKDNSGAVLYFEGFLADISTRKQAEAEKEKLHAQLVQAQKMEAIGTLAGGIAHDFNNMLTVIFGYTQSALDSMSHSDPLYHKLEQILNSARRSANLTKQLLAFARKQVIDPKVIDLNRTVKPMLKMLGRLIGEDIELCWEPSENLWPVKVDPSQIDQVLVNLCVNARDAIAGVGKIIITTGTYAFDPASCTEHADAVPGEFVRLAVHDNGPGMSRDVLGKMFEPFFTTKRTGRGTGLGLATVYGIVSQNNGFITVDSGPDRGTVFNIHLPRHAGEAEDIRAESPLSVPSGLGETVLVVEDDPDILEMLAAMLEKLEYDVLSASAPGQALRLAQTFTGTIRLLITDVIMPEMNGRELAGRLKEICPDLDVLFMSGYTSDVIAHQGILDEGVSFIQKPFSMQDIAARVRRILAGGI